MTDDAFSRAKGVYLDRYGTLSGAVRRWQGMAFLSTAVSLVCVISLAALALQSKVVPYIVQVDQHGYEILVGPAEDTSSVDHRIITAQLARFFRELRTVLSDPNAQKAIVSHVMASVASGSSAAHKTVQFYQDRDPLEIGKTGTIECEVASVLPLSKDTWQVEWMERRFEQGALAHAGHFKAVATVDVSPTRKLSDVMENPLGVYVIDYAMTELD